MKILENSNRIELPTTYQRKKEISFKKGTLEFSFHWKIIKGIEKMRKQASQVSFSSLFLYSLQLLLYRYSTADQIRVQVIRKDSDLILPEQLNSDLFKSSTKKNIGELSFKDLSFVETSPQPTSSFTFSKDSFFQIIYEFQPAQKAKKRIEPTKIDSRYEIFCSFQPFSKGISLGIQYNEKLFDLTWVQNFFSHWENLLWGMLESPELPIGRIPLLTKREMQQRKKWTHENIETPLEPISILFQKQVKKSPRDIAVLFKNETWTYSQMGSLVNQLGFLLQKEGVESKTVVGVYFERSVYTLISMLAIWKLGAIYLPLERNSPLDYIQFIIQETGANILLMEQEIVSESSSISDCKVLYFQKFDLQKDKDPHVVSFESHAVELQDQAAIFYTSGSTGTPKGVAVTHEYSMQRLAWGWETYPFSRVDVVAQHTTLNFVVSLWEFFSGLLKGNPTLIVPEDLTKDPVRLVKMLSEFKVTHFLAVPSLTRMIVNSELEISKFLSSIKYWISCGEPLSIELYEHFFQHLPKIQWFNQYGASEVFDVAAYPIQKKEIDSYQKEGFHTVPVGYPVSDTMIHILNDWMNPVPLGTVGELYIEASRIAMGYVQREEETKKRFLSNPFEPVYSKRLYRMGDLGKYLPDGKIQIIGRRDNQVKIRGIRIEIEGIEAEIRKIQNVEECVVIANKRSKREKYLIAYLVTKNTPENIRKELENKLPVYMIPSLFIFVKSLPKKANGKYDRQLLLQTIQKEDLIKSDSTENEIHEFLRTKISGILNLSESIIKDDLPFFEMGADSVSIVDILGTINQFYHLDLEISEIFNHPTILELRNYIQKLFQGKEAESFSAQSKHLVQESIQKDPQPMNPLSEDSLQFQNHKMDSIAIIGVSGKFPGASTIEKFWKDLSCGVDAVCEVPIMRWDTSEFYDPEVSKPNKTVSKWAGILQGIDEFDPGFFNISPKEAELMDPQQRLCLEEAWKAFENAGYSEKQIFGDKIGTFIGVRAGDYLYRLQEHGISPNAHTMIGNDSAILASRIAYYLNMKGPAISIDTACSSSLVALQLAVQSIHSGECKMALVGGVHLFTTVRSYLTDSNAGMLSPSGKCKTFDFAADGIVPGEAVGMIVIKPLNQAIQDHDRIHAFIKGIGINQDGKTNGMAAPSSESQSRLLQEVYEKYQINPQEITYLEAHGTGTKLGDPIEIKALNHAFRKWTPQNQFCAIGSVKTNVGHSIAASGMVSLIKVLLAMKYQKLPATLHCSKENEYIDFKKSPFYVNQKLTEWKTKKDQTRQAAISSFGFSGTNAHLVLEEVPKPPQEFLEQTPLQLMCLSAKTKFSLEKQFSNLLEYLEKSQENDPLEQISYTLNTKRTHFQWRSVFFAESVEQFCRLLKKVLAKKEDEYYLIGENVIPKTKRNYLFEESLEHLRNSIGKESENIQKYKRKLFALGELYRQGCDIDWNFLYKNKNLYPLSLPTYPFAKERYWVDTVDTGQVLAKSSILHPLLHSNTSDLSQQSYSTTLTGEEFFLKDHQVNGQKLLPAVAYLEMARVAVAQASLTQPESTTLELHNTVWAQPIVVTENKQVTIALFANDGEEIDYEIYSQNKDQEILHCQGQAVFTRKPVPAKLDIKQLQGQMQQKELNPNSLYDTFTKMGINYGPSLQGITAIYQGDHQLLAQLSLPATVEKNEKDYLLHPSLMDSALQASIGLIADLKQLPSQPVLPFSLESISIVAAGTKEMYAWVRCAQGSQPKDKVQKLDMDLCDTQGNICVKIRGFSSRELRGGVSGKSGVMGTLMVKPVWQENLADTKQELHKYTEHWVFLCGLQQANDLLKAKAAHIKFKTLVTDQKTLAEEFEACATQIFEDIRQILQTKPTGNILLQVVVSVRGPKQVFSGLSGLLKTASLENPKLLGQVIEVRENIAVADLITKLEENSQFPEARQIRYEADGRLEKKRLVCSFEEIVNVRSSKELPWKVGGVYLITGGAGGLGFIFAKEIAEKSKGVTLILTGRSALSPEKKGKLKELDNLHAKIIYQSVDVADQKSVEALIRKIRHDFGELNGIIHSAGLIQDNFILKKTPKEFQEVLAPKVFGTINLDQVTKTGKPLDFFVLFSSGAGVLGNAGQADYATANAFMDAFAHTRNTLLGLERTSYTLAINWPLWKAGGMGVDETTEQMMKESSGMVAMETSAGIEAFYQGLSSNDAQVIVMTGFLEKMKPLLLADKSVIKPHLAKPLLSQLNPKILLEKTLFQFKKLFGEVIKLPISKMDPEEPLESYGIDSIMITQLNQKLVSVFGEISKTLFFEYQTLGALTDYFIANDPQTCAQWAGLQAQPRLLADKSFLKPSFVGEFPSLTSLKLKQGKANGFTGVMSKNSAQEPIAIIGISGRYPQAKDLTAYWENLKSGKDCIVEIPEDRWSMEGFFHPDRKEAVAQGKSYSKWGGFLEGFCEFDPLFFNISPREAMNMDPQERLFLQSCWVLLEDAGYTKQRIAAQHHGRVGVFAGITKTGFDLYGPELRQGGQQHSPHTSFSSVANRVSYCLNLQGPSMPIDTMCSSSLTAIHEACGHLRLRECEMAIAGGVNLYLHPSTYISLCAQYMLSGEGQCKSFGKNGNGFVPGEGVGVVLLKSLSKAIEDKDSIYAVIRATSVNHGGKTNGYTVPSPKAQARLIRATLDKAGIDARMVSYIEAHGTGTTLGDPIEITGLSQAFQEDTIDKGFCAVGSAKSNLGHLEAAAGIAGLTKILFQMRHKKLVPSLHARELNPNIDFKKTPFVVQQDLSEWKRPVLEFHGIQKEYPRIAGISSFGAGGSNAHILIEEYLSETTEATKEKILVNTANPVMIVLSAKNAERLQEYAKKLLQFIQGEKRDVRKRPIEEVLKILAEKIQKMLSKLIQIPIEEIEINQKFKDYGVGPKQQTVLLEQLREVFNLKIQAKELPENDSITFIARYLLENHKELQEQLVQDVPSQAKENHPKVPPINIVDLAFTLQVGREGMEERLGLIVHSIEALEEKLRAFINGEEDVEDLYMGQVKDYKETLAVYGLDEDMLKTIEAWIAKGKYRKLLGLWVKGLIFDWHKLYGGIIFSKARPQHISAPTYPFARESYWVDTQGSKINNHSVQSVSQSQSTDIPRATFSDLLTKPSGVILDALSGKYNFSTQTAQIQQTTSIASTGKTLSYSAEKQPKVRPPIEEKFSKETLQKELVSSLAKALYMKQSDIDIDEQFIEIGLDPIVGVEWIQTINKKYKLNTTATKIYDYPSIREFSEFLKKELDKHESVSIQKSLQQLSSIPSEMGPYPIIISSPSLEQLKNQIIKLQNSLSPNCFQAKSMNYIQDLSYTLMVTREQRDHRVGFLVDNTSELSKLINLYLNESTHDNKKIFTQSKTNDYKKLAYEEWFQSKDYNSIISKWVSGVDFDWGRLELKGALNSNECQRGMPIPGVSFVKEKYRREETIQLVKDQREIASITMAEKVENKNQNFKNVPNISLPNFLNKKTTLIEVEPIVKSKPSANENTKVNLAPIKVTGNKLGDVELVQTEPKFIAKKSFSINETYLQDHIVKGVETLPGVVFLEWVRDVFESNWNTRLISFEDVVWLSPFQLSKNRGDFYLSIENKSEKFVYEIYSISIDDKKWLHGKGCFSNKLLSQEKIVSISNLLEFKDRAAQVLSGDSVYLKIRESNVYHGPTLQTLISAHYNSEKTELIASLGFREDKYSIHKYPFDPGILDGCFQCVGILVGGGSNSIDAPYLPFAMEEFYRLKPMEKEVLVHVKKITTDLESEIQKFNIDLVNFSGEVLIQIKGFAMRRFGKLNYINKITSIKKQEVEESLLVNDNSKVEIEIKKALHITLFIPIEEMLEEENLLEMGLDSILGVEFVNLLNKSLEIKIKATSIYEYPSIAKLNKFIKTQKVTTPVLNPTIRNHLSQENKKHNLNEVMEKPVENIGLPETSIEVEGVAIIGIAAQFAGSKNVNEFWDNLIEGRELLEETPISRFDIDEHYHSNAEEVGGIYCRNGYFLDDIDNFDPLFFKISPREAEALDPQVRLLLEESWKCFEDAGYADVLSGTDTGVYVGNCFNHYFKLIMNQNNPDSQYILTGNGHAVLPNRISYHFNLKGPSLPVDTGCSSSLVALEIACDAIKSQKIKMALVAGASLNLDSEKFINLCSVGALSKSGEILPFDERADGFVAGEGVAAILLKDVNLAIQDRDNIYCVIKSTNVRHGGFSGGPTVPDADQEIEVMYCAWKEAKISTETIGYYEAHGTGTKLGDPLELKALAKAVARNTKKESFCHVGSVKANIGHTEEISGLAGIIKILMMMKHKKIPGLFKLKTRNKMLDEKGPVILHSENKNWDKFDSVPRRACVSSFGLTGTLAHAVLEEFDYSDYNIGSMSGSSMDSNMVSFLPFSAKNLKSLSNYILSFHSFIHSNEHPKNIGEFAYLKLLAYNLQIGRQDMKIRTGIFVKSLSELKQKIESLKESLAIEQSNKSLQDWTHSQVKNQSSDLLSAAWTWLEGAPVNWMGFYKEQKIRKISLPTYQFEHQKYWFHSEPKEIVSPPKTSQVLLLNKKWIRSQLISTKSSQPNLRISWRDGEEYGEFACRVFEEVQKVFLAGDHKKGFSSQYPYLIQVIIPSQDSSSEAYSLKGISGLVKTAALENPKIFVQLIEIPTHWDKLKREKLLGLESGSGTIEWVRYEGDTQNERYVSRFTFNSVDEQPLENILWQEGQHYLITGGAGGLGLLFIQEISQKIKQGTIHITGRRQLYETSRKKINELSGEGIHVVYHQADITDEIEVKNLFQGIDQMLLQRKGVELKGVIHSAGIIRDNFIIKKTTKEFQSVLAPKVQGTYLLDKYSRHYKLDFFSVFGSTAGVMGNVGQSDYATANSYLDAYVEMRNKRVLEGKCSGLSLSIDWPLWQEGGMQIDPASQKSITKATGATTLTTRNGMQAFYQALKLKNPQAIVLSGKTDQIKDWLVRSEGDKRVAKEKDLIGINNTIEDSEEVFEKILEKLKEFFGTFIKMNPNDLDGEAELENYGIDSVLITQMNQSLAAIFTPNAQEDFPKTLFYEYGTLSGLAEFFLNDYPVQCSDWVGIENVEVSEKVVESLSNSGDQSNDPIAVIGMSGRYPQAKNLDEYWENLQAGKNCITEIPTDRWDMEHFYEPDQYIAVEMNKSYSKWGGFVDGFADFDAGFFILSPRESMCMDPQERMFIEECFSAIEDAGVTSDKIATRYHRQIGVFGGITKSGHGHYGALEFEDSGKRIWPYTSFSSISNRVSWLLNLQGPSIAVDTMCSSSLIAVHLACESIKNSECKIAIVGGVNIYTHPSNYVNLCAQRMLSKEGKCRSFGKKGDGFVTGEGVGVYVLKPLSLAEKDHDNIHAIIRGTHINHGGKTNGYTVPNPILQGELVEACIKKANLNSKQISYIEAHGTGTELGDPIEVKGLTQAFRNSGDDGTQTQFCALGSAKSNIGHLEAAAGIAGLTKIILQMKHKTLVASLHSKVLNPNIGFHLTPFKVQQEKADWHVEDSQTRIAGISSFGAGGANAHVIVEEYRMRLTEENESNWPLVFPFSSKSKDQLQQQLKNTEKYIQIQPELSFENIAYTLQTGRNSMEWRVVIVAENKLELVSKLKDVHVLNSAVEIKVNREQLKKLNKDSKIQEKIEMANKQKSFVVLGELWMLGLAINWKPLYKVVPSIITLPTFAFNRKRYWINSSVSQLKPKVEGEIDLLTTQDGNISKVVFTGNEPFLKDHKLNNVSLLPGVVYLEMVRKAVQKGDTTVELTNTTWVRPFEYQGHGVKEIFIELTEEENLSEWKVYSMVNGKELVHAYGNFGTYLELYNPGLSGDEINIQNLKDNCQDLRLSSSECYEYANRSGFYFGPGQQGILELCANSDEVLVKLEVPKHIEHTAKTYFLHPCLLDSAIQGTMGITIQKGAGVPTKDYNPAIPFYLEKLIALKPCEKLMWAHITKQAKNNKLHEYININLYNSQAKLCISMINLTSREVGKVSKAGITLTAPQNRKPKTNLPESKPRLNLVQINTGLVSKTNKNRKNDSDILTGLRETMAKCLFIESSQVDIHTGFIDMGIDSVVGVDWIRDVNKKYNLSVPAIKIYDYPNLTEFSSYINKLIIGNSGPAKVKRNLTAPVIISLEQSTGELEVVKDYADIIKECLANATYTSKDDIDENIPLQDIGLDSITGVEWIKDLNKKFKTKVAATKVYDYPSLKEFSEFYLKHINPGKKQRGPSQTDSLKKHIEPFANPNTLEEILHLVENGEIGEEKASQLYSQIVE